MSNEIENLPEEEFRNQLKKFDFSNNKSSYCYSCDQFVKKICSNPKKCKNASSKR